MKKASFMRTGLFPLVLLAAGLLPVHAGSAPTAWEKAVADKFIRFLPGTVQGLTKQFPWDPKDFNKPGPVGGFGGWSREEIPYDPEYAPAGVNQRWRVADPRLVEQVKKAEKDAGAMRDDIKKGEKRTSSEDKERERKLDEWQRKMDKAADEGNMAEIQRLQKEYQKIAAPFLDENKQMQEREDRPGQLKKSARELRVVIQANLMPKGADIWSEKTGKGKTKAPKSAALPAATIKGYPVGRNQYDGDCGVSFSIVLASPGFTATSDAGPRMRQQVKAIYIMAEVRTNPENREADEALALKMLEKVDYAGLAKLLSP